MISLVECLLYEQSTFYLKAICHQILRQTIHVHANDYALAHFMLLGLFLTQKDQRYEMSYLTQKYLD